MALSYESHVDLAFDTASLRSAAAQYQVAAEDLLGLKAELERLLGALSSSDWTTQAGKAFETMVKMDWSGNLDRYCDLLSTLSNLLRDSADEYDALLQEQVDRLSL